MPVVQVLGNVGRDLVPFERGEVPERMVRRRLLAVRQVQVVEPRSQRLDRTPRGTRIGGGGGDAHASRATNLKNRLGSPSEVSSWYRNASSASSNLSKNSSHSIISRSSSSVKAIRRMPASSSPDAVPATVAGLPPRISDQRRILPWSVVRLDSCFAVMTHAPVRPVRHVAHR